MLARHLIARHMKRESVPAEILPPDTVRILQAHHWSGNVRELSNVLEHALILSDGKSIRPEDLPRSVLANRPAVPEPSGSPTIAISAGSPTTLRDMEAQMIRQVLDKHDGDKPKAARELGIALKTLYNRLNQLPIPPQGQRDAG
jgi:DNA-binding NtrC family response regulator